MVLNLANNTMLTPIKNSNGYFKVGLANGDGTSKQINIHTLVAQHYLPNPYQYPMVNHKDGNKANNYSSNLEWCTCAQNINHALKTGLRPGYMSANDKESYVNAVLQGALISDIAARIGRPPTGLSGMLRRTADRTGQRDQWNLIMKERRKNVAIRNLKKVND